MFALCHPYPGTQRQLAAAQQRIQQLEAAPPFGDAIQIQKLQRQLAVAEHRIQQLEAVPSFGDDFRTLAEKEAVGHTTIAIDALPLQDAECAEEAHGGEAAQKAQMLQ